MHNQRYYSVFSCLGCPKCHPSNKQNLSWNVMLPITKILVEMSSWQGKNVKIVWNSMNVIWDSGCDQSTSEKEWINHPTQKACLSFIAQYKEMIVFVFKGMWEFMFRNLHWFLLLISQDLFFGKWKLTYPFTKFWTKIGPMHLPAIKNVHQIWEIVAKFMFNLSTFWEILVKDFAKIGQKFTRVVKMGSRHFCGTFPIPLV